MLQNIAAKLGTAGVVMEETGLTLQDVKTARMVTTTEEGFTLRKFIMSATTTQLIDLTKLHIKVTTLIQGDRPQMLHFSSA